MANNFKIVHIVSVGINGGENIIQKYINYINIFLNLGIDYKLVILCPDSLDINKFKNERIIFLPTRTSSLKCVLKRIWINNRHQLIDKLKSLKFDALIIRIDFMDKTILDIIKIFKCILEYPSAPIEESTIEKPIYNALTKKFNKQALNNSLLNITVTKCNYPKNYVLHNSLYDQHKIKYRYIKSDKSSISVLFLSSYYDNSSKLNANGYDRFLNGLKNYYDNNGKVIFKLYVGGKDIEGFKNLLKYYSLESKVEVIYLGFVTIQEINQLIDEIDIGINDLALHRKNLSIANSLKTIDFIAWHLPFIIGYKDVNINYNHKYFLEFENNEEPIDIQRVINFVKNYDSINSEEFVKQKKEISLDNRLKELITRIKEIYVSN